MLRTVRIPARSRALAGKTRDEMSETKTSAEPMAPSRRAKPRRPVRAPTRRLKETPLNERDWVEAATEILVQENVRGIKIEKLCAKLGVTKGSFYWHFKKRNDILVAMLREWRRRATLNVIQNAARSGIRGFDMLRRLIEMPRRTNADQAVAVEMSIRDWARRVEMPKEALLEVDTMRFEHMSEMYMQAGFDEAEAKKRSYLTYCVLMGDAQVHRTLPGAISREDYIETAIKLLSQGAPAKDK